MLGFSYGHPISNSLLYILLCCHYPKIQAGVLRFGYDHPTLLFGHCIYCCVAIILRSKPASSDLAMAMPLVVDYCIYCHVVITLGSEPASPESTVATPLVVDCYVFCVLPPSSDPSQHPWIWSWLSHQCLIVVHMFVSFSGQSWLPRI